MMAPTETTLIHSMAPIHQMTPVQNMTEMVLNFIDYQAAVEAKASEQDRQGLDDDTDVDMDDIPQPGPSSAPLFADSHYYKDFLMFPACTPYELWLQNVLLESEVNRQLQAKEEKKSTKGKKRLMGDGKAKLFSGDKFYQLCVDNDKKILRMRMNVGMQGRHKLKRSRNGRRITKQLKTVAAWEAEKEMAKAEKRKPRWNKPKWKYYNPEKMKPRPKKPAEDDGDDGDENSGSDDDVESD
ncbi:hypothetical protein F5879DRAFT_1031767 [Lentinula edodes]|nr:hypothetical protein F5879DRAFT_1031767 [Lentinula edodes]